MTEDERLINETWPLIRETVSEWRPVLERTGFLRYVQGKTLRDQLDFWLHMSQLEEFKFPEVVEEARKVRRIQE